ncbi:Protein of unknown function DUF2490 [Methylophilaceae bacterium]
MIQNKKAATLLLMVIMFMTQSIKVHSAEEDGRAWINLQANGPTGVDNLRWYVEVQPRFREELKERDQFFFRPAVYYAIAPKTSLWLGYVYVRNYTSNPVIESEHRYWQQLLHEFEPINGVRFRSMTRFEQRNFEGANDTGYKLRQRFTLNFPIENYPNLSTLVFDEYHLNLNETDYGARSGFDQNRLFAGFAWKSSQQILVEFGYLNQYVNLRNEDAMNHILASTVYFSFN